MGEAKRRAAAVAAGLAEPREAMIRLRERITLFEPSVVDGIERERQAFNTEHRITLDFDVYLNALLQVALEREREQREALAEAKRLAAELAAKQANTAMGTNTARVDEMLSTMAPAVERSAA